ncbi:hypothetical protein [Celeribacter neptunius]|uniref:Uncharacterized protein n=1 Tax=Celeribacter neptunius TaxID=588602 RepID=A0A1I3JJZ5_9RHOB|nr:hypothetical protein [Celeribacter neptunius]SFI60587.1 hypothetical protein SAMN04487991_0379 [Celeribacter neptunius]
MSEISDFEARITAALERIGRAVAVAEERAETAQPAEDATEAAAEAEISRLTAELEVQQATNSQLEARVKAIHDRQEGHVASLEEEIETLRRQLMDHDQEMQKLRHVTAQLRDNNAALRAANAEGLADAGLIDAGMKVELDSLRVAREAEKTELDAIVTELRAVMARNGALPSTAGEV